MALLSSPQGNCGAIDSSIMTAGDHSFLLDHICVAVYMSNNQAHIQALQWIIRHLQHKIQSIQDIINQLSQEEDPNLIFIEAEPIFVDNDKPIRFAFPSALLQQEEAGPNTQDPNLKNASLIAVAHAPTHPQVLT